MLGTTIYIWHNDRTRYDEVIHLVGTTSEEDAQCLAHLKLQSDLRITHVQVEIDSGQLLSASR